MKEVLDAWGRLDFESKAILAVIALGACAALVEILG